MIRTKIIPCKLPKAVCDDLNRSSGRIYTEVCVYHWRTYRKKRHWISRRGAQKINDYFQNGRILHAHTIDAAQEGFYKAIKTTWAARKAGFTGTKFPYRRKFYRTTIWKTTAVKKKKGTLTLSNGLGNQKIKIKLPEDLQDFDKYLEVRMVYDRASRKYNWHIVVENGKKPKKATGRNVVSVDLGEIHPAVVGDRKESHIITCRELRCQKQGHNKRKARFASAIDRAKKGSRRHKKLCRSSNRMSAKHKRVVRDMEHKISREVIKVAVERKAKTIVVGDVRNIADGVSFTKKSNQKISQWNHGKISKYIEYKAEAEGMEMVLESEAFTTQTCTKCGMRHKPKGRVYSCPACGFQSHRDVVGQINILSVYKYGEPGKIKAPRIIKHRIPHNLRVMRRRPDTGQLIQLAVACD